MVRRQSDEQRRWEARAINLIYHILAAERLRQELGWPQAAQEQMFLGAIAPDAHTECARFDRTALHPEKDADVVSYLLSKLSPGDAIQIAEGRAFAVGCLSHLVADELTRGESPAVPLSPGDNLTHLDEAELQRTDLIQGLENTLTVIKHELGDRIRVVER